MHPKRLTLLVIAMISSSMLLAMQSIVMRDYYGYSAAEKNNFLWQNITETAYENSLPQRVNSLRFLLNKLNSSEEEYLEVVGSVAQIKLVSQSNFFSGIFSSGAIGYLYFSLRQKPSLVFKFLVDDSRSLDLKISNNNYNINQNFMLGREFSWAKSNSLLSWPKSENRLEEMARRSSNNKLAFELRAPENIIFKPCQDLIELQKSKKDFRDALSTLAPQILYKVYTKSDHFMTELHIADIVLESAFVASQIADERIFFDF